MDIESNNIVVSIIITSYNRGNLISKAIESVLTQNYKHLEIIIIDNNSTDNSHFVINSYLEKNPNIIFIKNEINIGPVPSLIKAISSAKGQYFSHVSSDDYLSNDNFISKAVDELKNNPNVVLIKARLSYLFLSNNKLISDSSFDRYEKCFYNQHFVKGETVFLEFENGNPITMGACIFNKNKFQKIRYDNFAPHAFDLQIILQLLLLGDAIFIDMEAYVVLVHNTNLTYSMQPVSICIDNLAFINEPYKMASILKSFSKTDVLEDWKSIMLYNYLYSNFKKYYKNSKKDFKVLQKYTKLNYPDIFIKITKNTKWIIFLTVYKFNKLGYVISYFIFYIKKIKNYLYNRLKLSYGFK
jgi:glycosyltransferase involved in cell wall biosynthesis